MKATLRTKIATASLALAAISVFGMNLQAQTYPVHFEFQVANKVLPAGDYRVENTVSPTAIALRNNKTGHSIFVPVGQPSETAYGRRPCLVFHRYGNEAFLAEIRTDTGVVNKVRITSREKELMTVSKPLATIMVPIAVRADE